MLSGVGLTMGAAPYAHRCFPTGRWVLLMLEVPLLVVTAGLLSGMASFDLSILAISQKEQKQQRSGELNPSAAYSSLSSIACFLSSFAGSFFAMGSGMLGGMIDGNNRWIMFAYAICFAIPGQLALSSAN